MKSKLIRGVFVLTLLSTASFCHAQDSLTVDLSTLLQAVEGNSRQVKLAQLNLRMNEADVQTAKLERLPELSARGSIDYATNMSIFDNGLFQQPSQHEVIHLLYNTGADFYLNLYKGSWNAWNIKEAQIKKELGMLNVQQTLSKTKLEVCFAFLDLQQTYILKTVLLEDVEDQNKQLKEIKDLFDNGVVLHSDVLRVELELSKREFALVEMNNVIVKYSQQIALLTGKDPQVIIRPSASLVQQSVSSFAANFETLHTQAFDLKRTAFGKRIAEAELRKTRASQLPQLSLEGNFTFANPQIFLYPYNNAWYTLGLAGLKLKVPISNWYLRKAEVEKGKVEILKEEEKHLFETDDLRNQLLAAQLDYQEAKEKEVICKKNILLSQENLRIIKDNYFQSAALITDLLDANMQVLKSKFEWEATKINQQHHYYQIEYLKGTL